MNDRPFITLNVAMTADGKTDTIARGGAVISSSFDKERVDRLRAQSDAVMVGGHTLLGDDPRLTVKSAALRTERLNRGLEENPIKVAVVTRAMIPTNSHFLTAGPARVIIFTTAQTDLNQVALLRQQGAQVLVMGEQRVDLERALQYLKQTGVNHLLVEGGGTLNEELLERHLIDEIFVYMAPLIFGGASAPTFASGSGLERKFAIPLKLVSVDPYEDGGVCYTISSIPSTHNLT